MLALPNERLKLLRNGRRLSQAQLAKLLGVGQNLICYAEKGTREPNDEVKVRISKFFSVSVEWLFFENRYPNTGYDQKGA